MGACGTSMTTDARASAPCPLSRRRLILDAWSDLLRAAVYRAHGDPDVVRIEEVPEPTAGPGAVFPSRSAPRRRTPRTVPPRGAVRAARRSPLSQRVGFDVAGIVRDLGPGVDRALLAPASWGSSWPACTRGTLAERAVLPAAHRARRRRGRPRARGGHPARGEHGAGRAAGPRSRGPRAARVHRGCVGRRWRARGRRLREFSARTSPRCRARPTRTSFAPSAPIGRWTTRPRIRSPTEEGAFDVVVDAFGLDSSARPGERGPRSAGHVRRHRPLARGRPRRARRRRGQAARALRPRASARSRPRAASAHGPQTAPSSRPWTPSSRSTGSPTPCAAWRRAAPAGSRRARLRLSASRPRERGSHGVADALAKRARSAGAPAARTAIPALPSRAPPPAARARRRARSAAGTGRAASLAAPASSWPACRGMHPPRLHALAQIDSVFPLTSIGPRSLAAARAAATSPRGSLAVRRPPPRRRRPSPPRRRLRQRPTAARAPPPWRRRSCVRSQSTFTICPPSRTARLPGGDWRGTARVDRASRRRTRTAPRPPGRAKPVTARATGTPPGLPAWRPLRRQHRLLLALHARITRGRRLRRSLRGDARRSPGRSASSS